MTQASARRCSVASAIIIATLLNIMVYMHGMSHSPTLLRIPPRALPQTPPGLPPQRSFTSDLWGGDRGAAWEDRFVARYRKLAREADIQVWVHADTVPHYLIPHLLPLAHVLPQPTQLVWPTGSWWFDKYSPVLRAMEESERANGTKPRAAFRRVATPDTEQFLAASPTHRIVSCHDTVWALFGDAWGAPAPSPLRLRLGHRVVIVPHGIDEDGQYWPAPTLSPKANPARAYPPLAFSAFAARNSRRWGEGGGSARGNGLTQAALGFTDPARPLLVYLMSIDDASTPPGRAGSVVFACPSTIVRGGSGGDGEPAVTADGMLRASLQKGAVGGGGGGGKDGGGEGPRVAACNETAPLFDIGIEFASLANAGFNILLRAHPGIASNPYHVGWGVNNVSADVWRTIDHIRRLERGALKGRLLLDLPGVGGGLLGLRLVYTELMVMASVMVVEGPSSPTFAALALGQRKPIVYGRRIENDQALSFFQKAGAANAARTVTDDLVVPWRPQLGERLQSKVALAVDRMKEGGAGLTQSAQSVTQQRAPGGAPEDVPVVGRAEVVRRKREAFNQRVYGSNVDGHEEYRFVLLLLLDMLEEMRGVRRAAAAENGFLLDENAQRGPDGKNGGTGNRWEKYGWGGRGKVEHQAANAVWANRDRQTKLVHDGVVDLMAMYQGGGGARLGNGAIQQRLESLSLE